MLRLLLAAIEAPPSTRVVPVPLSVLTVAVNVAAPATVTVPLPVSVPPDCVSASTPRGAPKFRTPPLINSDPATSDGAEVLSDPPAIARAPPAPVSTIWPTLFVPVLTVTVSPELNGNEITSAAPGTPVLQFAGVVQLPPRAFVQTSVKLVVGVSSTVTSWVATNDWLPLASVTWADTVAVPLASAVASLEGIVAVHAVPAAFT